MKKLTIFFLSFFVLVSCTNKREKAIEQIKKTEKAFEQMVAEKGLAEAFGFYAAPNGVKYLGDTLIIGHEAIKNFYLAQANNKISLRWETEFAEASKSGDLAYTYGKYTLKMINSEGKEVVSNGIFHTVWQKQKNGEWKFVWD